MDAGQINMTQIVGAVIVANLVACPVQTLCFHYLAWFDGVCDWHIRVPTVMHLSLCVAWFGQVDFRDVSNRINGHT